LTLLLISLLLLFVSSYIDGTARALER
jgi:hypothetical protein